VGAIWPCHLLKSKTLRMAISVGKFIFVFSYSDQNTEYWVIDKCAAVIFFANVKTNKANLSQQMDYKV
jgi:hypothetical protein